MGLIAAVTVTVTLGCSPSVTPTADTSQPSTQTSASPAPSGWDVPVTWGGRDTPGMGDGIPNPHGWYQAAFGTRTKEKILYLTFDDGPSAGMTDALLAELAKYDALATFFVVGSQVSTHRDEIQRIVSRGHALGDHTMTHADLDSLSAQAVRSELSGVQQLLGPALGRCMRPPYGLIDNKVATISKSLNLMPILWTGHAQDWSPPSTSKMIEMLQHATEPGAVILLHDAADKERTLATVAAMLPWWQSHGYRLETVPACQRG